MVSSTVRFNFVYLFITAVSLLSALSYVRLFPLSGREKDRKKFEKFVIQYNRSYVWNENEFIYRFLIFQYSLRRHERLNAGRKHAYDALYGINQFSDLTEEEFKGQFLSHLPHVRPALDGRNHDGPLVEFEIDHSPRLTEVPKVKDWRDGGFIGDVRDQGSCGACWAFSIVETMASMKAIDLGKEPQPLSAQQLLDCSDSQHGCTGGDTCKVAEWLKKTDTPVVTESAYPYQEKAEVCVLPRPTSGVHVNSLQCEVLVGREDAILSALANHGPVTVSVDATTWHDYISGIIQYHCETFINHAVQIIGYNLSGPVPYYIVRNQWGTDFGDRGYLYIQTGKNLCGIAQEVVMLTVR